ncbi:uncharacterized protein F4822DRAFT_347081 [Hypoxylon trugodes]|uniref:uncharacterized protein n=1 Tax=Hypoxylon trugodes TaxID=326681 RepID=UPI00219B1C33|nr:uncharacterized protein F4822DRAFT_347081 [Hypoxylon trugodes]KAI1385547.1 hypothetical protein F4822DRAFT_347081 [Hypoxylon trugodes]
MNSPKRKRAHLACKPCRERKRKCDGRHPCITCTEWGYDCYYETSTRRRTPRATGQATTASPARPLSEQLSNLPASTTESEHYGLNRDMEANSGAAFVRKLGLRIDPTNAPRLSLFAWNLGSRQLSTPLNAGSTALPIVEITSLEHMKSLAQVYFDKVDPCYGFINRPQFFERLDIRWNSSETPNLYDSILAGVAAIGCLFSQRNVTVTEVHLVRSAYASLDNHQLLGPPSIDLLIGWTLRSIYLRITDSPHSTWIASSTLMHLVEASGLHSESPASVLLPSAQCDPDTRRRLVGVARHINTWTSFDLGLSLVSFQKDEMPLPPSSKPGDYTDEILGLLPIAVSLHPGRLKDETDLTSTLFKVLSRTHTEPPSVMAQCNTVLCIIRRIHTQNLDMSSGRTDQVLDLFKKGLSCARSLVASCSPWHQAANVPFQIVCVLLVMDTRSSLSMLPEAMQTLSLITSTYDTETMREAYGTACLLVLLHQQRRKSDIAIFGEALNVHQQERNPIVALPPPPNYSSQDSSWLEALVADFPGLERVDLDQFLNMDMTGNALLGGPE